jgi:hypothetical protein
MGLFKRKRDKRPPSPAEGGLTREKSLTLIPVKNRFVEATLLDNGLVRLSYPTTVKPWFSGAAKRLGVWNGKPMTKHLELDEMGTLAWDLINGAHTVKEIIAAFAARYDLQQREAEISMTAYIRELGRRGVIAFRE